MYWFLSVFLTKNLTIRGFCSGLGFEQNVSIKVKDQNFSSMAYVANGILYLEDWPHMVFNYAPKRHCARALPTLPARTRA